ncbi:NAD(P)-dependent oxidoreductase [Streptacidiphilus pinicola]|uniref:NAD(P)-dependent oxidoreductase n=1 Tax=Streptacidiphilus pinicola TaxID=2219663 RepID=A0A2X0ILR5_9ACTN|nr:NAD(P)H-binding protein [Streptacidiphilus pinicola]RAG85597.1 NAD(P)-dependent oxidoreductase [Streptacidiphilus pinicola]
MAKIAVLGAKGAIGSRVVTEALARGHQVTAVVRDPATYSAPEGVTAVVAGDVLESAAVAEAATGQDVLVSAVGGGDGPGHAAVMVPAAQSLVQGLRGLGSAAPRLIAVGGAGSLETAPGVKVWDAPGLPDWLLQIMHAHGDAQAFYNTVDDVTWTVLSPAALIQPGERTGSYRTGLEQLVVDAEGNSHISTEDYAVALVDEIEQPAHLGRRFTVGR